MRDKRILALLFVGFVACVPLKRTPEARFFVLVSTATAPTHPAPGAPAGIVGLVPLRVPGYLERPQMVTWLGPGELRVSEFSRWAEPLAGGIQRVIAEDLATLLPSHRVLVRPWPGSTAFLCRVSIEVTEFGLRKNGKARLVGRYTLLPARGETPLHAEAFDLERVVDGDKRVASEAMVGTLSQLLGDLSGRVARTVRELSSAPVAPEP